MEPSFRSSPGAHAPRCHADTVTQKCASDSARSCKTLTLPVDNEHAQQCFPLRVFSVLIMLRSKHARLAQRAPKYLIELREDAYLTSQLHRRCSRADRADCRRSLTLARIVVISQYASGLTRNRRMNRLIKSIFF